jgi:hypothetical protein
MQVRTLRQSSDLFNEMTSSAKAAPVLFLTGMMLGTSVPVFATGEIRFPYSHRMDFHILPRRRRR